uniref:Na+/H+ antiporter, NhaD family n=1 Tax=Candidatus Kentrum sp. TUN TaxID=2126343 RepID=A0A450ZC85_9GAMM|nr:MAG: Na+/H+ antiporter, NhaD family [Candidatus Kentron sp. TUN]VFK51402.1 MAG: Na+/H+ antiporter, NhaD family [Candidatus Kentron sp. TUN]VFK58030.1 MAG: Na+/H+ antiporter, NhaD family [Candidatus Kentron sp. TUN]
MIREKSLLGLAGFLALLSILPGVALASGDAHGETLNLTAHGVGYFALAVFAIAYLFVMAEEFTHLRKSKPVILAAGIIWGAIAWVYVQNGMSHAAEEAFRHNLLEYVELFLFLLAAMTYINAMDERQVFEALRSWLVRKGFGFRQLFWLTGILAFFISPVADNLTTALLMCAVIMAVGAESPRFVGLACINVVVAANAGGAFSPFGDITTLMVWQKGIVDFSTFFMLFIPSVVNFMIPAAIMHFAIPNERPHTDTEVVQMRRGAITIMILFLLTIATAVSFHNFLHMPPVLGMMTGLAYLKFFGFYLKKTHAKYYPDVPYDADKADHELGDTLAVAAFRREVKFDVFKKVERAEWDTLLFFYGVISCVGGLGFIGYLAMTSELMYVQWGASVTEQWGTQWAATPANVMVGILSAIVDNIPVMFAVLTMMPDMSQGQWLLVTLTAGVGGSMLSIGSAAGVALMGQARGMYTFFGHLKWTWAIALGYVASIIVHMWFNKGLF